MTDSKEYAKQWREKNREHIKAYDAHWKIKNREKVLANHKRHWLKNRTKKVQQKRLNYEKNRERILARQKELLQKNPDRLKRKYLYACQLAKREPEKHRVRDYSFDHRNEILKAKGNKCNSCGAKNKLEIHHKKYTKNLNDLEILCKPCHGKIRRVKFEGDGIEL